MICIRSQNKESLGYTNKIGYTDYGTFQRKGHFIVDADEVNHAYIGEYSTKERALQVLDEIQQFVRNGTRSVTETREASCGWNTTEIYGAVYEMPAE